MNPENPQKKVSLFAKSMRQKAGAGADINKAKVTTSFKYSLLNSFNFRAFLKQKLSKWKKNLIKCPLTKKKVRLYMKFLKAQFSHRSQETIKSN